MEDKAVPSRPNQHRTVWISDLHLGHRSARTGVLSAFLESVQCDQLYLVGDVLDFHCFGRDWRWPECHSKVLELIVDKSRMGTRVFYLPGNHDQPMSHLAGFWMAGVEVVDEAVHHCADGRKLLVVHGDKLEGDIRYSRFGLALGGWAYARLLSASAKINRLRARFDMPRINLAGWVNGHLLPVIRYARRFETCALGVAVERGVDGIVCGHLHMPAKREVEGLLYANCGDWVEHCTAMVECVNGEVRLIDLSDAV